MYRKKCTTWYIKGNLFEKLKRGENADAELMLEV